MNLNKKGAPMKRSTFTVLALVFSCLLALIVACVQSGPPLRSASPGGGASPAEEDILEELVSGEEAFPSVARMTIEQLAAQRETPGLVIVDVRPEDQWMISDKKIQGAVHENPERVESWAKNYAKDATLVLYCA